MPTSELKFSPYKNKKNAISGRGETGRRVGFRFLWETVQVQILSTAPNKNKTNLDEKSKFVLFFTRDYLGLIIKLK